MRKINKQNILKQSFSLDRNANHKTSTATKTGTKKTKKKQTHKKQNKTKKSLMITKWKKNNYHNQKGKKDHSKRPLSHPLHYLDKVIGMACHF